MKRLEELEKQMAQLQEEINFIKLHEEIIEGCKFPIVFSTGKNRVVVRTIEQVTEARTFLQQLFGTRKFEYCHSFYCGETISTFTCKGINWEIWLECSIADFPEELKANSNCQWQEVNNSKEYTLVCSL